MQWFLAVDVDIPDVGFLHHHMYTVKLSWLKMIKPRFESLPRSNKLANGDMSSKFQPNPFEFFSCKLTGNYNVLHRYIFVVFIQL